LITIPRVEIQPVDHCTLACAACQHGSPQRDRGTHPASAFLPLMDQLATFARWESLIIGGGEPFLSSDLPGFIRAARRGVPTWVISNGHWLLRPNWMAVGAEVLQACTGLMVSRYPVYVDRLGVPEWNRRLEVLRQQTGRHVGSFHPDDPRQLTFDHHVHHHEPLPIVRECSMRFCYQLLLDGRLGKCPLTRWPDRIPGVTDEFLGAASRSLFYDLARAGEGFAEWAARDAVEACHFCGLATGHVTVKPWENTTQRFPGLSLEVLHDASRKITQPEHTRPLPA
jgi:hypothetical protein